MPTMAQLSLGHIPKFGRGSKSWAGREKRTAARSETPINLRKLMLAKCALVSRYAVSMQRYLLKILKKVLNLELSSCCLSTFAFDGVAALEGALELAAELGAEAGLIASRARSAMGAVLSSYRGAEGAQLSRLVQVQVQVGSDGRRQCSEAKKK